MPRDLPPRPQPDHGGHEAIHEFLAAVQAQDAAGARHVLDARPALAHESLHVAAALGLADEARRLIAEHPSRVSQRAGDPAATPLLFLCFSPFHGESAEGDAGLLATARLLLDANADANTLDGRYGVPALYGVTGMRSVPAIARLLLAHGANPTDGESVFHAAEQFHEDALELLLGAGADLNHTGEWGNTPLYFLLHWHDVEREPRVRQGFEWLLDHGADPNVRCGEAQESALHVAARRGQAPGVIQHLLDHGADVHARRGDGRSAWLLATRGGFDEVVAVLERAGAMREPLSPVDALVSACGRGEADAARRLATPTIANALEPEDTRLLPEAAAAGRVPTVLACLAAGLPVNATDSNGNTALHHAAIRGNALLVHALLDAGADVNRRDPEHRSTPLGWAFFGADYFPESDGDYPACVRALLEAGARPRDDEHHPGHAGVRAVLRQFQG